MPKAELKSLIQKIDANAVITDEIKDPVTRFKNNSPPVNKQIVVERKSVASIPSKNQQLPLSTEFLTQTQTEEKSHENRY